MKKKLIFAVAIGFFAVATVLNLNLIQSNNADDVSLDAIAIMAQAGNEAPPRPDVFYRRGVWTEVSVNTTLTLTAQVDKIVITPSGPTWVRAGGSYEVIQKYVTWKCIGMFGRC